MKIDEVEVEKRDLFHTTAYIGSSEYILVQKLAQERLK